MASNIQSSVGKKKEPLSTHGMEGYILDLMKHSYKKPKAKIILNSKRLNGFP